MSRDEIQKLLGGYATDTLSEAEQRALFAAALDDQELFDSLAREQALRDVLHDPLARQRLLEALDSTRPPAPKRLWQWLRQPAALAMAGGVAILLIVGGVALLRMRLPAPPAAPLVSQVHVPPTPFAPPPPPSPKAKARLVSPPAPPVAGESFDKLAMPLAQLKERARALQLRPDLRSGFVESTRPQASPKPSSMMANLITPVTAEIRYSLLRKGENGDYTPARLDTVFHPGDSVRLQMLPNEAGYLYVLQRDSSRAWKVAFSRQVEGKQSSLFPESGALQYDEPGVKEFRVVFSPQPESPNLDAIELDPLIARPSAGLLNAIVVSRNNAYTVVNRAPTGQQKLAFEVTLQVR